MDNQKVFTKESRFGKGVFAKEQIKKGEVVAEFDGPIYDFDYPDWNEDIINHVIQFEERRWRDSKGLARNINHSCEPNCGVKDKFKIVAMRNIKEGEEVTWDYEMTEDYLWRMKCRCGSKDCRGKIGAFRNMPENVRQKYAGFISDWLIEKYKLAPTPIRGHN